MNDVKVDTRVIKDLALLVFDFMLEKLEQRNYVIDAKLAHARVTYRHWYDAEQILCTL